MKIVYMGTGEFGLPCLDALAGSRHSIELVVTAPGRGAGRGRIARPGPVAMWGKEKKLAVLETANVNDAEPAELIEKIKPDLIVVIAFGQKVSQEIVKLPKYESINVHASLLPKYRGAAPINWAIVNGEPVTGNSIITLSDRMDAGFVLGQNETEIAKKETAGQLHDRLAKLAGPLLLETIDKIENGTAEYKAQDESQVTIAKKLKKSDGYLDFSEPAELLERKIRGFYPWPEASCMYCSQAGKQERVILALAKVVDSKDSNLTPGTFDNDLNVTCGEGALKILKIKPAGKKLMDFSAFVNGRQCKTGDKMEKISS